MNALSISGGGIKGIIPICALIALEQQLGKQVRECFGYIAGCSTGSDLLALIEAGIPMTTVLEFYTGPVAKKVFSPSSSIEQWPKRLLDGYIYDPTNLSVALKNALGTASTWTINDCPTGVLVIACDTSGKPWFFVKDGPKNSRVTGSCSLVECVVASSVAPTYFNFSPVTIKGQVMDQADGGTTGYANPVFRMAKEMFKYDVYEPADTKIISLGTGLYTPASPPPVPKGLIGTISFATSTLVNASETLAFEDLADLYPECEVQVFNPPSPNIDEADLSAIPELVKIGKAAASQMDWKAILKL